MTRRLRIDFVSDIACPWCVIGLASLRQALGRLEGGVEADIHFQPFELNPDMPPEGENTTEHVRRKYGSDPERSRAAREAIRQAGADLGFTFNYSPESRIWNTLDAHRLLFWAGREGRQMQLKEALFRANFTEQKSMSDPDVLVEAAVAAGLDAGMARTILGSDMFLADVRAEQSVWRNRGISAVPAIIFNQRWMIQGGQPSQVFEQAIARILAEPAAAPGARAT
jgi:predicted DsbA family dithiol-disulfide isomerase